MNIKSYILGLSALSMVGLSACDTDNVRSIYENATAGITFLAEEQEESFSETATDLSFNVDVVRQNAKGETTVNLISTCMKENESGKLEETTWNDNITVPSTVTFKDGETMTSFKVSLGNDIEQGMEHYVNVVLDTEEEPVDAYMSKLLIFSRAYTYGEFQEKTLTSKWFSNENHDGDAVNKTIQMQQGTQNIMIYRTKNVYRTDPEDKKDYLMVITLSPEKDGVKTAKVAETQVAKELTVSGEGTWNDNSITLKMKFVDTKNKKEYKDIEEIFSR